MKNGQGQVVEVYLGSRARILCPPELIPAPGQYLLAHAVDSIDPLPDPVFFSDSAPDGFRAAPYLPSSWVPGTPLNLRGPLGHGFVVPAAARKVALVAFDDSPERLRGLIPIVFKQDAEVVLVSDMVMGDLPEAVEMQPLQALTEIYQWADYVAFDVARENLQNLVKLPGAKGPAQAQVLIRAPMPCGAIAECGVCSIATRNDWKMICKDGPVFDFSDFQFLREAPGR